VLLSRPPVRGLSGAMEEGVALVLESMTQPGHFVVTTPQVCRQIQSTALKSDTLKSDTLKSDKSGFCGGGRGVIQRNSFPDTQKILKGEGFVWLRKMSDIRTVNRILII
jgi:hypothetical protein